MGLGLRLGLGLGIARRRRFSAGGMYGPGPAAPPKERRYRHERSGMPASAEMFALGSAQMWWCFCTLWSALAGHMSVCSWKEPSTWLGLGLGLG